MPEPAPAPAPAPTPDPAPAPAPAAWHAGVEADVLGTWQNKGYDLSDPKNVAIQATKAYREAQKFVGVPETQLLRLPKDAADEAGWKSVWTRLGAPSDPKEYDFAPVKHADGSAPAAGLIDTLRTTAANLHLPKDRAAELAAAVVKHLDDARAEQEGARTAKLTEEKGVLAKSWGQNAAANKFIASQAAAALGVKPDDIAALEGVVGYARVMELFRQIGTKIGEDKFISTDRPGGNNQPMTREGAQARRTELMRDTAWVTRYRSGDTQAMKEMMGLNILISGDDGSSAAA